MLPRHPDTIPNLAADIRRELRDEYQRVQVAADPEREINEGNRYRDAWRRRTKDEIAADTAKAVTEYKRVATMWGVNV